MRERKDSKKLETGFHIFIILFAIGVILSSIVGNKEMERATMYILLGIIIGGSHLFRVIKIVRKQKKLVS
ncbi:hypothetical protein M3182_02970 [Mesobacillus maritimus]|uniref:hypothetical protein n=1 Tax=Mesobacillus maritimus TaxID=1643336 RepID=UPI00203F60F1|nr:hypothetical protein [Mesobacillus maritimus]MCM3584706.1 hypothetical protein [Mesobacillus maritimus]MCM3671306.1 hypothetical protein [Mesobacillus maritimus]